MTKKLVYVLLDFEDEEVIDEDDGSTYTIDAETNDYTMMQNVENAIDEISWLWEECDHPAPTFVSTIGVKDFSHASTIIVTASGEIYTD